MVKFYNLINHQANNRHQKQHIKISIVIVIIKR
jgi:hypothetical protein